eukprot:scaffold44204_cov275-Isochrysis_galbana.AAC.1
MKHARHNSSPLAEENPWEQVFDDMPPNGDVNQLPPHRRLEWPNLPRGSFAARQGPSGAMGSVDMVENPDVNPIQGMNRSYDDVRRDLARHQQQARAAAHAAGSPAPIFRAEYVFISMGSAGRLDVALGRVCNVPPGKNGAKGVTVDVAVYAHTPPARGLAGFFGSFAPAVNPNYNPSVPGSKKFIRNHQLPRSQLLVLNVQVFTVTKKMYVRTSSLQLLALAASGLVIPVGGSVKRSDAPPFQGWS